VKIKKILFVTHSAMKGGGSEIDFEEMLKFFSTKSNEYSVHALFPKGQNPEHLYKFCSSYDFYRWGYLPSHPVYGLFKYIKYLLKIFEQLRTISSVIKKDSYDLYVLNVVVLLWPALYLGWKKKRVIVFVRENIHPNFLKKIIYKLYNLLRINIVTNSFEAKDCFIICTGSKNVHVIYPGITKSNPDSEKCYKTRIESGSFSADKNFTLVNIGDINPLKNQRLLVEALIYLKERNLPLPSVVFIGGFDKQNRYCKTINTMIDKYDLRKQISFLGKIDNSLVLNEIRKSDALIITSITEGMPISMIEAFSLAKPVLSTRVGGVPEVLINNFNGYILSQNTQDAAMKINSIMSELENYSKMSSMAYSTYIKHFQYDRKNNEIDSLFRRTLENS